MTPTTNIRSPSQLGTMARLLTVLALTLTFSIPAHAFQPFSRVVNGVTIHATRSEREPCGVDLEVRVPDTDQRLVIIDYSYRGTFDTHTFTGVYKGGATRSITFTTGSRGESWNLSMGNLSRHGITLKAPADPQGLVCTDVWSFNFVARVVNFGQQRRDAEAEKRRLDQEKIDEANRKKAEQAENQRRAEAKQREAEQRRRDAEDERRRKYLETLRAEGVGTCILGPGGDISPCEKMRARHREEKAREAAAETEARRRREAEERSRDEAAARAREIDAEGQRMRANPCSYADEQMRSLQPPQPSQNTSQSMASVGAYNQRVEWLSSVVKMCSDRDPCAGAEIFARRGPAQMLPGTYANATWLKSVADWNAKAKADFQPTLDRLRGACTAARSPAPTAPSQYPAPTASPYSAQPSAAPTAQATDPCQNLRQAYENDKKNIVLAYQLRRCIKKNRQAVQVQ